MEPMLGFFQTNGFVLELLCCNVLFACSQKRRSCFWGRIILSVLVLLLSAALLNSFPVDTLVFNFSKHVIWFFLTMLFIMWAYEISFSMALFSSVGAFVCQHMAFKVGESVLKMFSANLNSFFGICLYLASIFSIYFVSYFVFVQRINRSHEKIGVRSQFVFLCVGVAVYTSILQFVFAKYADKIPDVLFFTYASLDILCCMFALSIQYGLFRTDQLEEEKKLIERILRLQEKKFIDSKKNIELINIKCHDLKKYVSNLKGLDQEELQHLKETLNVYDMTFRTGNEVLDIVLAEKSLICQQKQIQLECMANGKILEFISLLDVYAIFSNAIDNAIESVLKVDDLERRYISISIREVLGMVVFHIENPYEGTLTFENGLPITTKSDKAFHGYGLKSIKHAVEKYQGTLSINANDKLFNLNITIPFIA